MTVSMCPSFSSLRADALFRAAAEQHAVRQDDRHHAFVLQVVEARAAGRRSRRRDLGASAVVLEPHVLAHRLGRLPAVAERRVGDDGVELRLLRGVRLAQHVPVVGQRVAVVDLELRVLHPVQQHVHAREVVGGDVLFLPVDLADAVRPHALAHVQQQRAGAAGEVEHAVQPSSLAGRRLLAVERDDGGEDVGDLLRRVELARLLARAGRELADQVLVGIAQRVDVGGELAPALRRSR